MPNPLKEDLDFILARTEGLWDEIRGNRIFITGGTAFVGSWLLESFGWANERLRLRASATVLTRNAEAFRKKAPHLASLPCITFAEGDVRTFEFPEGEFSHFIHGATASPQTLDEENPLLIIETIMRGTRRVLEFAQRSGVKKLLLTSSGSVYGKQPENMSHIPEEYPGAPDPTSPLSAYSEGKRISELLCSIYNQTTGIQMKIARSFAFVGPHMPLNAQLAAGNFIRDVLNGSPIIVNGDGTPCRSYLYAGEMAVWLWTILFRGKPCYPYNVGSERVVSIAELAHRLAGLVVPCPEVRIALAPTPGKSPDRYVPSTARAASELGLHQVLGLAESLKRTLAWFSVRPSAHTSHVQIARDTVGPTWKERSNETT
jgi:nucleoside-diphosphate-sugar epimerase